jgi:hypothetical protein
MRISSDTVGTSKTVFQKAKSVVSQLFSLRALITPQSAKMTMATTSKNFMCL